jgi:polynucleotide 5'-triphosphatase
LPATPLKYHQEHLMDSLHEMEGSGSDRIRVTRNIKTDTDIECVRKIRLGNLDIYSPKYNVDWRVGVILEVPGQSVFLWVVTATCSLTFLTLQFQIQ